MRKTSILISLFLIGCGGKAMPGGDDSSDGPTATSSCGACEPRTRCDESSKTCVPADVMAISLGDVVIQGGDGSVTSASVDQDQVCGLRAAASSVALAPDATDGPCTVTTFVFGGSSTVTPPVFWQPDAGAVMATGSSVGPIAFSTPGSASDCLEAGFAKDATTAFSDGDTITFAATGGADIPAFSEDLTVPPALLLQPVTLSVGAPIAVAWSGSDSTSKMILALSTSNDSSEVLIECLVEDTGSFTIPASMTSHLLASSAELSASRDHHVHLEPDGISAVVDIDSETAAVMRLTP